MRGEESAANTGSAPTNGSTDPERHASRVSTSSPQQMIKGEEERESEKENVARSETFKNALETAGVGGEKEKEEEEEEEGDTIMSYPHSILKKPNSRSSTLEKNKNKSASSSNSNNNNIFKNKDGTVSSLSSSTGSTVRSELGEFVEDFVEKPKPGKN